MIDWLAEIGDKRPSEVTLWTAYKRVIVRVFNADPDVRRVVNLWKGNAKRRSLSGAFDFPGGPNPWFINCPWWADLVGPRPDEMPLMGELVTAWHAAHPEMKAGKVIAPERAQPLSKSERFRILVRDHFRCVYCGAKASDPGVKLAVDHVKPRSKGGTNDPSNLVTSCEPCNAGKSDRTEWAEGSIS